MDKSHLRDNHLPIGIAENSVLHTDARPPFDLETKFRMVRDAGIFDYLDIDPPAEQLSLYRDLSAKYDLPIRACGYIYQVGRDEAMLEDHLRIAAALGSKVLNVQLLRHHADGHVASNEEVAQMYAHVADLGETLGCLPCFEVHVDMWSEDFDRVEQVADFVEAGGRAFRLTLDPSHLVFKIDNAEEGEVLGLRHKLDSGSLVIDPSKHNNVMRRWIDRNFVWNAHARSAVPNNPRNIMARHPDGRIGRGIQYPFVEPATGHYHAPWSASALEPWKTAMRMLLAHHAADDTSPLGQISVEFIPFPDYGAGGGYSIFENAIACGNWLRDEVSAATRPLHSELATGVMLQHLS
jgi:hypothetical protein